MIYSDKLQSYIFDSVDEMEKNADLPSINEYVYGKIESLLSGDAENIILFYITVDDVMYSTFLTRAAVVPPLRMCLKKFEAVEDYEMCAKCFKLINSLL
jgi:hypothetical protein